MVTFLNSFYKMFDGRLSKYDIFKVDTVNDCHMIASGVPEKNGDKHAPEIATMALDLLVTELQLYPICLENQMFKFKAANSIICQPKIKLYISK